MRFQVQLKVSYNQMRGTLFPEEHPMQDYRRTARPRERLQQKGKKKKMKIQSRTVARPARVVGKCLP
jgi:hypothetical protein